MSKIIVWNEGDKLAIFKPQVPEDEVAEFTKKYVKKRKIKNHSLIDEVELPDDWSTRDDWKLKKGKVVIDPSPPTIDQINAECDRRLWAFLNVKSKIDAITKQQNYWNTKVLLDTKVSNGESLTAKEQRKHDKIIEGYSFINNLIEASNILSSMKDKPVDYKDDKWWGNGK